MSNLTNNLKEKRKIELSEIPVIVKMEQFYSECFDATLVAFDYELFGEKVFEYLKGMGLKKFI